MKYVMNIDEVMKYLPQRFPFLFVDKVIEIKEGESIKALKNVTINEAYFTGHFPGRPVMPGVLIIEALAQAGGVLAYKSTNTSPSDGVLYLFAGIDNARFRRIVEPGDQLILNMKVLKQKRDMWKLAGEAFVGDELACSAEFLSARRG